METQIESARGLLAAAKWRVVVWKFGRRIFTEQFDSGEAAREEFDSAELEVGEVIHLVRPDLSRADERKCEAPAQILVAPYMPIAKVRRIDRGDDVIELDPEELERRVNRHEACRGVA